MPIAVVTGSAGLVGSESTVFLHKKGLEIVGIDNDMGVISLARKPQQNGDWKNYSIPVSMSRKRHKKLLCLAKRKRDSAQPQLLRLIS